MDRSTATRRSSAGSPHLPSTRKPRSAGAAALSRGGPEAAVALAEERLAGFAPADIAVFAGRLRRWWPDLVRGWESPYATHPGGETGLRRLIVGLADRYRDRPAALRAVDDERAAHPDWFQDPSMIGYVCYPARFGGTIGGGIEKRT